MGLSISVTHDFGAAQMAFDVQADGGTTVVFGRSGSGKTSLVNMIAGLLTPDQGEITLDGETLLDTQAGVLVPPHKRQIGYVFQDARLFPHLSVAGNLDYGARFAQAPLTGAARGQLIDVLGIGHLLERRPGTLSGGETQRVALGRALMTQPRLLLLDEPLAALDAPRKQEILPYLERLRAQGRPPMIYVTHDMSEIVRLADRLVVLRGGRCVVEGSAQDVLSDPANMPLIGVQDAGALVHGALSAHTDDGLSLITLSAGSLLVPRIDAQIGTRMRLRLRAQDVLISIKPPEGLSSLNALPAKITNLRTGEKQGVAVALISGQDRLLARVTTRAVRELGLKEGQTVWAILKASAVPRAAIAIGHGQGQGEGK